MHHSTSIESSLSAHTHVELLLSVSYEGGVNANMQSGDHQCEGKSRGALLAFQENYAGRERVSVIATIAAVSQRRQDGPTHSFLLLPMENMVVVKA